MKLGRNIAAIEHDRTPLVVRGSLQRTFWSMGIFAEAALLFCGLYLLAESILRPLEANGWAILGAGVTLALASVLLFYLVSPGLRAASLLRDANAQDMGRFPESVLTAYGEALQARSEAKRALDEEDELPGPM
jgi:hypothetical protein